MNELNVHIKELDDDIDNFMKPKEKKNCPRNPRYPGQLEYKRTDHHLRDWYRHEPLSYRCPFRFMGGTVSRQ